MLITEGLSEAIIGNDSGVLSGSTVYGYYAWIPEMARYSNSDTRSPTHASVAYFSFDQGSSSREVTTEQPFQECPILLPEEKPGL